ncbi:multidrug efflux transporter transcriptional repressor AcrR [Providencia burhodogranariea]|uniref:DNA-binding transcriptional repressor AcrR n=1 Tax=Providencia burhodogranariea DSM 19968 TaxID=1141662 RepID=K8WWN4_9GAMM|nr:multidrug efflux transporter transcriptional repressor AcrR [Providencia burhodogranariea]EKT65003.1 DNA-binding transcriptional repressor AcrR [Providencia burhodogranariea DSM 19968]
MARKTKQQAEETRQEILDAAIKTFSERGVSSTSLADIAKAAGVTRGAIYWHFKNKVDLFHHACEFSDNQIQQAESYYRSKYSNDPLAILKEILVYILTDFIESSKNRALMDILFHKCELVGEMASLIDLKKENYMASHCRLVEHLRNCIDIGQLPANLDLESAAILVRAMTAGLIENWLLQPESFNIPERTETLVTAILETLKYSPSLRLKT